MKLALARSAAVLALALAATALAQSRAELDVQRTSGTLDRGASLAAMRDTGNAVQRCLLLARDTQLTPGPRAFRVEVAANGAPTVTDAAASPPANPTETAVRACMRRAIGRVQFPANADGASVLTVTVRLVGG